MNKELTNKQLSVLREINDLKESIRAHQVSVEAPSVKKAAIEFLNDRIAYLKKQHDL